MDRVILIMAGGSGSRLWPLSRRKKPKQSHRLFSNVSTFENLLSIAKTQVPIDHVYISVGDSQYEYVSCTDVPTKNILLQNKNKNTAPAILYSINKIREDIGECTIAILPSDHLILDEQQYCDAIKTALNAAEETRSIIAIGTQPIYPSTGFGYIEIEDNTLGLQKIISFKEKPSIDMALLYSKNNHLWNTGIYVSNIDILLEAYKGLLSEMYKLMSYQDDFFDNAESVSFDVGIIEKIKGMHVVVSDYLWLDIGTYEFLEYYLKPDSNGNTIQGNAMVIDSNKTTVISEDRMVVSFGTKDLLIVNTHDVVFICDKKFLQRIGILVDKLIENGGENLL